MKKTKRLIPFGLVLAGLLTISQSCKKQETAQTGAAPTAATAESAPAASGDDIRIGVVLPLTGPIATYGQESVGGLKLALKMLNEKGVKGKKISLIIEDNKGEPTDSANAVRKLIDINKVHAIIGSVASSNTLASAPISQENKVPHITPSSTNEKVTQIGEYVSRTCFTDNFQGVVMAKFAKEGLSKMKAAVIVDNSSDYAKGLAEVFEAEFKKLGGQVLNKPNEFTYTQKDTDFRSLLRKVQRVNADVIFLPGYYTEAGLILKQAKQMGMNMPFLGGDGWDSPKLQELAGPEAIKGNYISSHFSYDDQDPRVQEFVKAYKAEFNENPGSMAALAYDTLLVVANAIERANSLNGPDLKDAINSTKDFQGVTGNITIDENRNARKSAVVLETMPTGNVFKYKVNP